MVNRSAILPKLGGPRQTDGALGHFAANVHARLERVMAHRYDPIECCCPGCEARYQRWMSKPANVEKLRKYQESKQAAKNLAEQRNSKKGCE